jgi:plasmid stabilization system protein ParE
MKTQHPITPPPELVQQWAKVQPAEQEVADHWQHIATLAAQWGADQELEACIEWLGDAPVIYNDNGDLHPGSYLRDARRDPKPFSLKKQALIELGDVYNRNKIDDTTYDTIRCALEMLPE